MTNTLRSHPRLVVEIVALLTFATGILVVTVRRGVGAASRLEPAMRGLAPTRHGLRQAVRRQVDKALSSLLLGRAGRAGIDATASETWWERIRWPDDVPLPQAGDEITLPSDTEGARAAVVAYAQPEFEPGWIEVEVRRSSRRH